MGVRVRKRDGAWWVFINQRGEGKTKKLRDWQAGKAIVGVISEP